MSSRQNSYASIDQLGMLAVFYLLYWPVAALVGDRPSRVARNEPTLVHVGCWISVLLHTAIALILVMNEHTFVGLLWLLLAGLLIVRRIAAGVGHPLPFPEIWKRFVSLGTEAQYVYGASALIVVTAPLSGRIPALAGLSSLVAFLSACAMLTVPVLVARTVPSEFRSTEALHAKYDGIVATAFGINTQTVYGEVGFTCNDVGLWLNPVPAALAAKLTDPAKIDTQLSAVAPELMLDVNNSGPDRILLAWTTDDASVARQMTAVTGGLITGVDSPARDGISNDELTLTLEDLE